MSKMLEFGYYYRLFIYSRDNSTSLMRGSVKAIAAWDRQLSPTPMWNRHPTDLGNSPDLVRYYRFYFYRYGQGGNISRAMSAASREGML